MSQESNTICLLKMKPDEFKHDASIDILTKYKRYIASKPWAASNYLRDPSKKPNWL